MKLLFTILFLLITSVFSFGQTSNGIDLDVKGVRWNSTYATVTKKLGKPIRTKRSTMTAGNECTGDAQTFLTLYYRGLEVSLIGDGRGRGLRVYEIMVSDKQWLASGIRVGTDVEGVKGEFGKPDFESADNEGVTRFLYNATEESTEVSVDLRDGKVIRILLAESIC